MKKFFILCICVIFTSCWEDTNDTAWTVESNTGGIQSQNWVPKGLRYFPWSDFSMKIPAAWNIITNDKNSVPSPKNGKLELAITSSQTKGGFANNLIILSQKLDSFTTSKEYSLINNVWAQNEYLNYSKISWKDFIFNDWEKSKVYVFKAKYAATTPELTFIQTAHICGQKKAFFLTIALSTDIKDTSKYEKMLSSFTCK